MAGPAPSFTNIWAQAGLYVLLWKHWDNINGVAATNSLDLFDDILQGVGEGTYTPDALGLTRADMARIAGTQSRRALAERWRPFLREMVAGISGEAPSVSVSDANLLRVIRQHMVDNVLSIKTRAMTLSTPVVVLAAGNGDIRRLTTDRDGFIMEGVNPELLTFKVSNDQNSGAREHAERFRVTGLTPRQIGANNALGWLGSGIDFAGLTSAHARSSTILRNSSFDSNNVVNSGDALVAVGDITNWVVATPANWKAYNDSIAVYRGFPGAPTTKWGLQAIANDSITQTILEVNAGAQFNPDVPYFLRVAWKRQASATGNITLNLGASSATVAIGSGVNDVWEHLFIPLDEASWFDVFNQVPLAVSVVIDSLAVGTVAIDDIVLTPMVRIGGSWYVSDGGDVAWEKYDKWSANSVDGPRAQFAYWLWRAFASEGWLPTNAIPTIPEP